MRGSSGASLTGAARDEVARLAAARARAAARIAVVTSEARLARIKPRIAKLEAELARNRTIIGRAVLLFGIAPRRFELRRLERERANALAALARKGHPDD